MEVDRQKLLDIYEELYEAIQANGQKIVTGKFEELRELLGWKLSHLCDKLEISEQTYHRWIKGESKPRESNLKKLEIFLREGDLEWVAPGLTPVSLGIHTWRHMTDRAQDPDLSRMWILSPEGFLEGQDTTVGDVMVNLARETKDLDICYVFPEKSIADLTWNYWVRPLTRERKSEANGRIIGFQITDNKEFLMFHDGIYTVLYEYRSKSCEGFLAFSSKEEVLQTLAAGQEEHTIKSDVIWMQVDPKMAKRWLNRYCSILAQSVEHELTDKFVLNIQFPGGEKQ